MSDSNQFKELLVRLHGPVTTTAVTVSGGPSALPTTVLADRKWAVIHNPTASAQDVYIGGSDVTVSTGIPVAAGSSFTVNAGRSPLFAVVSGANVTVRILEIA